MSTGDDDSTPPRGNRPSSHWDDNKRAEIGAKHRVKTSPHGVPIMQLDELEAAVGGDPSDRDEDEEVTGPQDLHELGPLTAREMELWESLNREKRANRARARKQSNQLVAAMGDRPPNERLTAIETRLKLLYAILGAIATLALGAVVTVAKGLYERGAADGAAEMRTKDLERRVEFLERGLTPDRVLHSLLPLGGPQP